MTIQTTEPTTALADLNTGPTLPTINPTAGTIDLIREAQELHAAYEFGTALADTQFVPAGFRGKPGDVAAAVLAGKSVGMDPMTALQNIFVVQGRPAMYARSMHAIVLAAGHKVERTEATNESVTVIAKRKGDTEWQSFTWTIDRAKQAMYTNNKKYQTDPIAMLTAKALAEACRTIAPDVLTGVAAYAAEEIELEDLGERPAPSQPKASSKLAAQRERAAKTRNTPKAEPDPEPAANVETGEIAMDWFARMEPIADDATKLRALWAEAQNAGADQATLNSIAAAGQAAATNQKEN